MGAIAFTSYATCRLTDDEMDEMRSHLERETRERGAAAFSRSPFRPVLPKAIIEIDGMNQADSNDFPNDYPS